MSSDCVNNAMEDETTSTSTTASPEKDDRSKSPNPSVNSEKSADENNSTNSKDSIEKDVETMEEDLVAASETKQKQGVKRKASEIESNGEVDASERGCEKKKKEIEVAEQKQSDVEENDKKDEVEIAEEAKETDQSENKAGEDAELSQKESVSSPSSQDSKDDISLPEKQTLGKGKRARIPNKRYSDIMMSPRQSYPEAEKPPRKRGPENGVPQEKENVNSESSKPVTKPSQPTKSSRIDITANPNYLKPFEHGWKREVVYRANLDNNQKRTIGDIYYWAPNGKKLRSMREIAENLKNKELALEDFTFSKDSLGLDDPEREIIRDARAMGSHGGSGDGKGKLRRSAVQRAAATAAAAAKGASSPREESPLVSGGAVGKTKTPATRGQSKQAKMEKKSKNDDDDDEMDVGTYPPNWQSPRRTPRRTPTTSDTADNKPCRPCSILCRGVMGLIPTLQCRICLCLYHNECVGVAPHLQVQHYECKNCQLGQDQSSTTVTTIQPSPTLTLKTHANTNATTTTTTTTTASSSSTTPIATGALSKLPKRNESNKSSIESKGLVGGVTTWFPSSSTIQVASNQLKPPQLSTVDTPRPQYVEFLGDKKYLIIPKHNIVSVSPSSGKIDASKKALQHRKSSRGGRESPLPVFRGFPREEVYSSIRRATIAQGGHCDEKQEPQKTTTARVSPRKKPITTPPTAARATTTTTENFYLQHLAFGYNTLLYVFQYLKVQDLLRAGCVCHMWRDVASHPSLWKTVRMKNSQVHSFDGLADTLRKHGTVHLDLRKMLLASGGGDDEIWPLFSAAIQKVDSLRKIELCRCPATVVEQLPISNPNLEVVNAVAIKCETMSLATLGALNNLKELRLKSTAGLTLTSDLSALKQLTQLKHLSLTSLKDLHKLNLDTIAELKELESLDLGECVDLPKTFATAILPKLVKLERLRLEKGQGECCTFEIFDAIRTMPHLEQLELVNFDVKNGFDVALGACANIKKLLVIPTYISQSATTNHMVLGGVLRLRSTLSHFVWGVTLELLRVTELFVDQCEEPDKKGERKEKKGSGDSIPVLKPVPMIKDGQQIEAAHEPPQVEILSLHELQKLLLQSLPTTRVKILKIPFHATWRQSITETVN